MSAARSPIYELAAPVSSKAKNGASSMYTHRCGRESGKRLGFITSFGICVCRFEVFRLRCWADLGLGQHLLSFPY